METIAQQFLEIEYQMPINPFAILKAADFIRENMLIASEGAIGNWSWKTVTFKDGSVIGWSQGITSCKGSYLTLFGR